MARISWNEIESRAEVFVDRWQGETYERGESQSFWTEFLDVYGIDRRRQGAFFEYAIKKRNNKQGFIDLFWPGKLLAEQKSGGKDLGKAGDQALDYLPTMPDHDLPRMIVTSDFAHLDVLELATQKRARFPLADLPKRIRLFDFLIDDSGQAVTEEDPVNRDAAEGMARLHNQLRDSSYTGHDLELLLVRIMFCLFADDARIFERGTFERYIRDRTGIDGSDLGSRLNELFQVLDTPEDQRQTTLDRDLQAFPYINGGLFAGTIRTPSRAATVAAIARRRAAPMSASAQRSSSVVAFQQTWRGARKLIERSAYQQLFLNLCRLFGMEMPAQADPTGQECGFEKWFGKSTGGKGFATCPSTKIADDSVVEVLNWRHVLIE